MGRLAASTFSTGRERSWVFGKPSVALFWLAVLQHCRPSRWRTLHAEPICCSMRMHVSLTSLYVSNFYACNPQPRPAAQVEPLFSFRTLCVVRTLGKYHQSVRTSLTSRMHIA